MKIKHRKIKAKDPFYTKNVTFFKVPLAFQAHMNSLSQSEKDVYLTLIVQVYYRKTLEIDMPLDTIAYWTGIKSLSTITNAIRGLAEKGWIKDILYRKQESNVYILNLEPTINFKLIEKIKERSEKTRKAKLDSIKNGEAGKFEKGNMVSKKDQTNESI